MLAGGGGRPPPPAKEPPSPSRLMPKQPWLGAGRGQGEGILRLFNFQRLEVIHGRAIFSVLMQHQEEDEGW